MSRRSCRERLIPDSGAWRHCLGAPAFPVILARSVPAVSGSPFREMLFGPASVDFAKFPRLILCLLRHTAPTDADNRFLSSEICRRSATIAFKQHGIYRYVEITWKGGSIPVHAIQQGIMASKFSPDTGRKTEAWPCLSKRSEKMNSRISRLCVAAALAVFLVLFAADSIVTAKTIMNGKEVTPYTGQIISHNSRTGEIVIKTENSTGHWRLSRNVVVLHGKEHLVLSDIWQKTKQVRAYVSDDGEVERITVLEWR
jgi:hypothetical protein